MAEQELPLYEPGPLTTEIAETLTTVYKSGALDTEGAVQARAHQKLVRAFLDYQAAHGWGKTWQSPGLSALQDAYTARLQDETRALRVSPRP